MGHQLNNTNNALNVPGRIFLVGMMGSGKSTTGKILADRLGFGFYDTDAMIEAEHGKIKEVFDSKGEEHFRLLEAMLLKKAGGLPGDAVFATGGGMPCFGGNIDTMRESGLVIYLECNVDTLSARLAGQTAGRPLIQKDGLKKRLHQLLHKRGACYQHAHLTVDANAQPEIVVQEIIDTLTNQRVR